MKKIGIPALRKWLQPSDRKAFDAGLKRARREGWVRRIRSYNDALAVANGCWFDATEARARAELYPRLLRHSKGKWRGQPFELADWERADLVEPLFGWKRPGGTRRYRRAYVEVPKKNGKSTLLAGLELIVLVADGEGGPEVYTGAVDRKQAGIVFDEAARMVRQSPHLRKRLQIIPSTKTITYPAQDGVLKALSADVESQEGLNALFVGHDETHALKNRRFYDTLAYAGEAREQPIEVVITTAGEYNPTSIGWELHEYAVNVISGAFQDWELLAVVYAADKDADWTDLKVWEACNPSWGEIIDPEKARAAIQAAKNSPMKLSALKRYRLNIWVQAANAWMSPSRWNACRLDYTPEDLRGRACVGGLDLSVHHDCTALVLAFPPVEDDEPYKILEWFWLPDYGRVERARRHKASYELWADEGWIEETEGEAVDLRTVRERINAIKGDYDFRFEQIGYDPYRSTEIVRNLEDDGFEMIEHRTGTVSMSPCMEEWERLVMDKKLAHRGNPVMAWMMGNVVVHRDSGGNIKPNKSNQEQKIDGPVAGMIALHYAISAPTPVDMSDYETVGLMGLEV